MKCLILAAGYATRLYPLTENFPKPLLEVGKKPILDWLIEDIEMVKDEKGSAIVDEYIIVSNHKFVGHFESWIGAHPLKEKMTLIDDGSVSNESRLGAVKDIELAIEQLRIDSPLFVMAGDNLLSFSLEGFIRYAVAKDTTCVMRYYEPSVEKLRKTGVLEIDGSDRILSMEEKPAEPKSHWCCPPFYIYKKEDVGLVRKGIASGCGTDAPGSFIAWLCGETTVHAFEMPGERFDIGNLESYETIKKRYE